MTLTPDSPEMEAYTAALIRGDGPPVAALKALSIEEMVREVCAELRARDAFWRADPPIARPRKN